MASKIDIPGTDNSVDPTDPMGALKTIALTVIGFMIAAGAASAGVKLWNQVAKNTPDQFQQVDLI